VFLKEGRKEGKWERSEEEVSSLIPSYIHDSSVVVIVFDVASKCLLFFSVGLFFVVSL